MEMNIQTCKRVFLVDRHLSKCYVVIESITQFNKADHEKDTVGYRQQVNPESKACPWNRWGEPKPSMNNWQMPNVRNSRATQDSDLQ